MDLIKKLAGDDVWSIIDEYLSHTCLFFDLSDIKPGAPIFILGKSATGKPATGKTELLKKILTAKSKEFTVGFCIKHENIVHPLFNHDDIIKLPEIIDAIEKRAVAFRKKNMKLHLTRLIIDDFVEEPDGIMSSKSRSTERPRWEEKNRKLLFNGRHYGIELIISSRYMLIRNPETRCQFRYIFIFTETMDKQQLKWVYKYYVKHTVKEKIFNEFIHPLKMHQVLVIDNMKRQICWYDARLCNADIITAENDLNTLPDEYKHLEKHMARHLA